MLFAMMSLSRLLDLITVVCTVRGPTFGDPEDVPVLMRAIYCRGNGEEDLNDCDYELAGPNETCQAGAGAVCVKRKKPISFSTPDFTFMMFFNGCLPHL